MEEVFADTNYWIAILNPKDSLFQTATRYSENISLSHHIVTSQVVLAEVVEHFAKESPFIKRIVLQFISKLDEDPRIIIVPTTPKLFEDTIKLCQVYLDKEWGFTDCSSFVIMKRRGIKDALTYDKHFMQAGFKALLRG